MTRFAAERVLITGAYGSLGSLLAPRLRMAGADHLCLTDIGELDVTILGEVEAVFDGFAPTLIYHLAACKYAPEGETDPAGTLEVNAVGTANVVAAAQAVGARVVTASTCKACDPETVYGATKLIAERLTLNAGGWVARFYNVRESAGNVFETWAALPEDEPLLVTPCWRYFISLEQAVDLLARVPSMPSGRYTVAPGRPVAVRDLAATLYPGRSTTPIPPRRGDRLIEPRTGASEILQQTGVAGIERVVSRHDIPELVAEAA